MTVLTYLLAMSTKKTQTDSYHFLQAQPLGQQLQLCLLLTLHVQVHVHLRGVAADQAQPLGQQLQLCLLLTLHVQVHVHLRGVAADQAQPLGQQLQLCLLLTPPTLSYCIYDCRAVKMFDQATFQQWPPCFMGTELF